MERTKLVQVRMSPGEKGLVTERARAAGQTVSEYVRGLALGVPAPRALRAAAALEGAVAAVRLPEKNRGAGALMDVLEERIAASGATEREQAGLPGLERTGSSRSAAPADVIPPGDAAVPSSTEAGVLASVSVFRCPVGNCKPDGSTFECGSPKVSCPAHGRKVVPA